MSDGSVVFSAREVMVLKCFASAWVNGEGHLLYGCLCYQDALDLLAKLKVDAEPVETMISDLEKLAETEWDESGGSSSPKEG